jgi:hypothetical protein
MRSPRKGRRLSPVLRLLLTMPVVSTREVVDLGFDVSEASAVLVALEDRAVLVPIGVRAPRQGGPPARLWRVDPTMLRLAREWWCRSPSPT